MRDNFLAAKDFCGDDYAVILEEYRDKFFKDSDVNKMEFFIDLESDSLIKSHSDFINDRLGNMKSFSDKRSAPKYCYELAAGWMIEERMVACLRRCGFNVELTGSDREREFLPPNEIDSTPDIKVDSRFVEISTDYGNWWRDKLECDLRHNKYVRAINSKALVLGVAIASKSYFILDPKDRESVHKSKHKPYGDKPATAIVLRNGDLQKLRTR